MRTARLVGPSPDGTSLIMADDRGEELVLAVDERLRAATRAATPPAGPPRPVRRETPMDSSLSPRDIQTRIRAGASVDELAEVAGLPRDRVERFAAPVLAEREHLALLAMSSSVRRRGETSAHRNLRSTVSERLLKRGVDVDTVDWDARRLDDGRWAVTAAYAVSGQEQQATFVFDLRGRFSVPSDEAARWLVGESTPGPASGPSRAGSAADEPTVDLSDELALIRAVQEPAAEPEPEPEPERPEPEPTVPVRLRAVPAQQPEPQPEPEVPPAPEPAAEPEVQAEPALRRAQGADGDGAEGAGDEGAGDEARGTQERDVPEPQERSELSELYAMLGSDGYSEDSPRVYAGLSDAAAVPETAGGGWEPAIVVDYPVEPSPADEAELAPGEHPDRSQVPMNDKAPVELSTPVDAGSGARHGTDEPAPPYARTNEADRAEEAEEFQLESEPAPPKPVKRKRASVPSWDEIMFGGPKPPG